MNGNLVSLALQHITPEIESRIATALGLDRTVVDKAITVAVPALLAVFAGTAAKPGGAERLAGAVNQVDLGALPQSSQSFSPANQGNLMDTGKAILSSVLGGSSSSALSQTLARFGNVNPTAASSLLSLAAPIVLGAIKAKSPNIDANRLASLLASQKANITSALPSGMMNALADSGVTAGLDNAARTAGQAASRTVAAKTQPQTMLTNWLTWIVPLIAIAGILMYFYGRPTQEVTTTPTPTTTTPTTTTTTPTTTEVVQPLVVDGVDVGKEVPAITDQAKAALAGVTDAASAQSALPKLADVNARVDKLTELVGKMSPDQKKVVAGLIAAALPALNVLADKVLAMPNVGPVLKPAVDGLRAKLDALAKA